MKHDLAWTAPQPFWTNPTGAVVPGGELARPQILRFASDEFMQELLAQLEQDPAALPRHAVYRETWRGPAGAQPAPASRWLERETKRVAAARRSARQRARALGTGEPLRSGSDTAPVLKLYQPAHLRHYLVSGSLVCRMAGLPDRVVDPARHKVCFVVRRLFPNPMPAADARLAPPPDDRAGWDEHAFVLQGKAGGWRKVAASAHEDSKRLVAGEERLAMFPAPFTQDDGRGRRLYVGNVPVGKREAYQGAPQAGAHGEEGTAAAAGMDPRLALFHTQVLAPWKAMVNQAMRLTLRAPAAGRPEPQEPFTTAELVEARPDFLFDKDDDAPDRTWQITGNGAALLRAARGPLQTASWYLLLDFADFLEQQIDATFLSARPADTHQAALFDALDAAAMPADLQESGHEETDAAVSLANSTFDTDEVLTSLLDALSEIRRYRHDLEAATTAFELVEPGGSPARGPVPGWPGFLFLFADPWFGALMPPAPGDFDPAPGDYVVEKVQARIDALAGLVAAALPARDPARPVPEPALATMQPADMREAWYVLRLVYERPDCAPFEATVVSDATVPFQMAGFFDPDAPARPVRIALPLDISPAGLRKFDKNTAFMLSDMLCGQMDRMKGIGLVDLIRHILPPPLHKPLDVPEKGSCKTAGDPALSLGVMCSLSIPIVTICALILLLIIASILDYIFRWLPYLVACFPLPGFKARPPEEP